MKVCDTCGTVELNCDLVSDIWGSPLHSNFNFGGRFGHSATYHNYFGGREAADHNDALKLDRQRDWHIRQGREVTITGRAYVSPYWKH
jgi:hypothetical protein